MKLLATNAKLEKATEQTQQYMVTGLTLAPHGLSGHQVCDEHSPGCAGGCNMWWSGRKVTQPARDAALRRTKWLFEDPKGFRKQLHKDLCLHCRRCDKLDLLPAARLNMASDLEWFDVIEQWPIIHFYDYTKIRSRFRDYLDGKLPSNYHLTFSRHERHKPTTIASYLSKGGNVSVVFDIDYFPSVGRVAPMPARHMIGSQSFPVINGDSHDIRLPWIDGKGVVVGLALKGTRDSKARAVKKGFAVEADYGITT
mgnify:CR=1 FL=1